jgi:2-keto-4-pentenoate hydratase/2-oxohepta-3-ene-1,7-dioic acid hydratase in catechol pathway
MRLASFRHQGRQSFGLATDSGIVDLGSVVGSRYAGLKEVLAAGVLAEVAASGVGRSALPFEAVEWLPPVPDSGKILCVGLNYRRHAEEAGMQIPKRPSIFVRFPDSQVGHRQPVVRPFASEQFDYEGELAVIIGRRARHVRAADALGFVAGYSCFAENSVRDFQRHATQATPGKNFSASGAFGPWMVTTEEIPDPGRLLLTSRLNGEIVQRESTGDMIFSVPELIEYLSTWTELQPGDVISTGTPSGVGMARKPPLWLKPGDRFAVEIEGIGILENPVVDERRPS